MDKLREQLITALLDIDYDKYRDYDLCNKVVDEIIDNFCRY
jgi:hypothetical protein